MSAVKNFQALWATQLSWSTRDPEEEPGGLVAHVISSPPASFAGFPIQQRVTALCGASFANQGNGVCNLLELPDSSGTRKCPKCVKIAGKS